MLFSPVVLMEGYFASSFFVRWFMCLCLAEERPSFAIQRFEYYVCVT